MGSSAPALRRCSVRDGLVEARWLGPREHPMLRELIELYDTFVGFPRAELDEHLARRRLKFVMRIVLGWHELSNGCLDTLIQLVQLLQQTLSTISGRA